MAILCKGKTPNFLVDSDIEKQEVASFLESLNNISSCISDPPLEDDSSDTSLKLG